MSGHSKFGDNFDVVVKTKDGEIKVSEEARFVVINPVTQKRRVFAMSDDKAKTYRIGPMFLSSTVNGSTYEVTAKSDQNYEAAVRWLEDNTTRRKA